MLKKTKKDIEKYLLGFAILTSILSFSLDSSISGICGKLMYLLWGCALLHQFLKSGMHINQTVKYMAFTYVLFFILCYLFYFMGFYPSPGSGAAGKLGFCSLFYLIGYNYSWKKENAVKLILYMALIAYLIVTYTSMVYIDDTIEFYLLRNKNQLGQMLGSSLIFEAIIFPRLIKNKLIKIFLFFSSAMSLITLMRIHSRTPIIAVTVIAIVLFFTKKNKTKKDYWIAVSVILIVCLIIVYMGGTEFLRDLFDIDSESEMTSAEGLNNITSGRLDWYKLAIEDFIKSPIIGIGAYAYIDNFIICTLRTGGILSAIFIFPFVYGKLFSEFKNANKVISEDVNYGENDVNIFYVVRCFTVFFFVISLMEGHPPLGPGTSVFFLWLMFGIADNMVNQNKINQTSDAII